MRLTKQMLESLRVVADCDGLSRATFARRLGIPYSSACSRARRLASAGLVDLYENGLLTITDEGIDAALRGTQ